MYLRIYPKKNNTIFYTQNGSFNSNQGLINTGGNPIMQLMEGNPQSELVFQFIIDLDTYNKIQNNNSEIKLKLWDAGKLPEMQQSEPKTIELYKNEDEFVEGIGYDFFGNLTKTTYSNYQYRNELNDVWENKSFVSDVILDKWHDDIIFIIPKSNITIGINTFFVKFKSPLTDITKEKGKFIHSNKTRTIKIPFLEIKINDEILDDRYKFYNNKINKLYLLSNNDMNFNSLPVFNLLDSQKNNINNFVVNNPRPGVYFVEINGALLNDKIYYDSWSVDGEEIFRSLINIQNLNKPKNIINETENLYFYPTTKYESEMIMWGDNIFLKLILNLKANINTILNNNFEYRLMCDNGFEMIPWQKVENLYDEYFFKINTVFLFPDMNYEVQVRLNNNQNIYTSSNVYRFKLKYNSSIQLEHLNASPYFNRDYYMPKQLKRL